MKFLLTFAGRARTTRLLAGLLVLSIADLLGIAAIFPYLQVVSQPELVQSNVYLARIYSAVSFQSVSAFTVFLGVVLLIVFTIKAMTAAAINKRMAKVLARLAMELTNSLYGALMRVRYGFFLRHSASEIVGVTSTHTTYSIICLQSWLNLTNELIFLGLFVLVALFLAPLATVVVLLWAIIAAIIMHLAIVRKISAYGQQQNRLENEKHRWSHATVTSIKDVRIMGLEGMFASRTASLADQVRDVTWRYNYALVLPRISIEYLMLACLVGVALFLQGTGASTQTLVPLLGVLGVSAIRVVPSFARTISAYNTYRYSKEFLNKLIATKEKLDRDQQDIQHVECRFEKQLLIQNLEFSYGEQRILDGISLIVQKGSSVGIVGLSGSGKSTLLDIIAGLQKMDSGKFFLDSEEVDPFLTDVMSSRIGYVPQHIALIDDSIAFNIAFERDYDKERLQGAIDASNLRGFVSSLPDRHETCVGEGGVRLSGGQRQRIGIARALYKNPEILIFDEATSALDNVSEKELTSEISRLTGEKTLIIVAHRLTTVEKCNVIHVLDHGRIVCSGTHQDLLRTCDLYQAMNLLTKAEGSSQGD